MAVAIMRGAAPELCLKAALDPDRDFNVPMAPELGLFLVGAASEGLEHLGRGGCKGTQWLVLRAAAWRSVRPAMRARRHPQWLPDTAPPPNPQPALHAQAETYFDSYNKRFGSTHARMSLDNFREAADAFQRDQVGSPAHSASRCLAGASKRTWPPH